MKQLYLPEAKNDLIFAVIGDKSEFIILLIGVFLGAGLLWNFLRKR